MEKDNKEQKPVLIDEVGLSKVEKNIDLEGNLSETTEIPTVSADSTAKAGGDEAEQPVTEISTGDNFFSPVFAAKKYTFVALEKDSENSINTNREMPSKNEKIIEPVSENEAVQLDSIAENIIEPAEFTNEVENLTYASEISSLDEVKFSFDVASDEVVEIVAIEESAKIPEPVYNNIDAAGSSSELPEEDIAEIEIVAKDFKKIQHVKKTFAEWIESNENSTEKPKPAANTNDEPNVPPESPRKERTQKFQPKERNVNLEDQTKPESKTQEEPRQPRKESVRTPRVPSTPEKKSETSGTSSPQPKLIEKKQENKSDNKSDSKSDVRNDVKPEDRNRVRASSSMHSNVKNSSPQRTPRPEPERQDNRGEQKFYTQFKFLSIVIPLFDEAESLSMLSNAIKNAMRNVKINYEVIFVDDGSNDTSLSTIKEICRIDSKFKFISFQKNYGKSAALQVGFKNVHGDVVVTMDADLQDDPSEIPNLLKKLESGFDMVSGWKKKRHDPFIKKYTSRFFNKVTSIISGIKIHDFNCGLKAYRRRVIDNVNLYGELHRYIPVLAKWKGFTISEIVVKHQPRKYGKTKFGASRFFKGFVDLLTVTFLTRYIQRPMHLFGLLGGLSFFGGFGINLYLAFEKFYQNQALGQRPLLFLGVLLMILGVQLFSTGLIGELIVHNQQSGKEYSIKEKNV